MSNNLRNIVAGLVILLLLLAAFAAGVVFNEYGGVEAAWENSSSSSDDSFDLLDEAWALIEGNYLGDLPGLTEVTYGAVRGALATVNDPYTVFIEPPARDEERERLSGNFGGIGAYLSRNEANELLLDPIPDNPAEKAGILSGDVLLAVDGVTITPQMAVSEVAELIKGEKGTMVTLTISRAGEAEPFDVAIERAEILLPSVTFKILETNPDIGYIQLTRFSGESGEEIERAISELQRQGAEKLVLDLRNNPGGLLTAAVDVADHFLGDVPVLYQQSQGQVEEEYRAEPGAVAGDMPLVVLVDGGTASSAEILAGALQDHERAYLVGAPTFGKGSVQLVFDLSDGSSIHVTASRWFTPDRHQIDQQGLQPDLVVEVTQEAIDAGRDEPLLQAIEYLQREN